MDVDISEPIRRVNADEPGAQDALFLAAYSEWRKLARSRLRDWGRNTVLDTPALVQEFYLRFIRGGPLRSDDRMAFFAFTSKMMCSVGSVIIDAVRERQAERPGGDLQCLPLPPRSQARLTRRRLVDAGQYRGENINSLIEYRGYQRTQRRISKGCVESSINRLIGRRMCKEQHMRWSRDGADGVVQVRVAPQNQELEAPSRQHFEWSGSRCISWPWMRASHPF